MLPSQPSPPPSSPFSVSPKQARASRGHPVDVVSGEQFTAWHDLELPGIIPLHFRRFYSTRLLSSPPDILGPGWTLPFSATLTRDLRGYTLIAHDGEQITFDDPKGLLEKEGGRVLAPGAFMELERTGPHLLVSHWHPEEAAVSCLRFLTPKGMGTAPLLAQEDVGGRRIECIRDREGRLRELVQTQEHRRVLLSYQGPGQLSALHVAGPGQEPELWCRYEYDARGRLTAVTDRSGVPLTYAYDDHHRLIQETGRTGGTYHLCYDDRGRCCSSSGDGGYKAVTLSFEPEKRSTTVTDALGHATIYLYDAAGQLQLELTPSGERRELLTDGEGRLIATTDGLGRTTQLQYDLQGNLASRLEPGGMTTRFRYNARHQLTEKIDPGGARWTWTYDTLGDLIALTDPTGAAWTYARDALGRIKSATRPGGQTTHFRHSSDQRILTLQEGEAQARLEYDALGRLVTLHDTQGLLQTFSYDGAGRLTEVINASGARQHVQHNASGAPTLIQDARGARRTFRYSAYGDLLEVLDPLRYRIQLSYDLEGRLVRLLNQKKEEACFDYDPDGRLIRAQGFDGHWETFTRDVCGQLVEYAVEGGARTRLQYDEAGRVTERRRPRGEVEHFHYDASGRLREASTPLTRCTFQYDPCGRVLRECQEVEGEARTLEYAYDANGAQTLRHLLEGPAGPIRWTYDLRGRPATLSAGEQVLQTFTHDPLDRLIQRTLGKVAVERRTYDEHRRLAAQQVRTSTTVRLDRRYAYDSSGTLSHTDDPERGTERYDYNAVGRLTRTVHSEGPHSTDETFTYDGCGNIVRQAGTSMRGADVVWEYSPGNLLAARATQRYENDVRGRRTAGWSATGHPQRYTYDDDGQLLSVSRDEAPLVRYGYDALGRRLWKDVAGCRTRFIWSGDTLAAEEQGTACIEWIHAGFLPLAVLENGHWSSLVTGSRGETLLRLDATGEVAWWGDYGPFGLRAARGHVQVPWRLLGQYEDAESGLCFSRFRPFDPHTGRFLVPDPLGLLAGLNPLTYARDPINWVDPWGLYCMQVEDGHSPSKSELNAAQFMSEKGYHVKLRPPRGTRKEGKTSDFVVTGLELGENPTNFDVYTPNTSSVDRIVSETAHKNQQTIGVVIDLEESAVQPSQLHNILKRVNGTGAKNIKHILVMPKE